MPGTGRAGAQQFLVVIPQRPEIRVTEPALMYSPAAWACAAYPAAMAWPSAHHASQVPPPGAGPQWQARTGAPSGGVSDPAPIPPPQEARSRRGIDPHRRGDAGMTGQRDGFLVPSLADRGAVAGGPRGDLGIQIVEPGHREPTGFLPGVCPEPLVLGQARDIGGSVMSQQAP